MVVEVGYFRCKAGTHPSLVATDPAASVVGGTGSVKLVTGSKTVMPAPKEITLVGDGAGSILTYYWV